MQSEGQLSWNWKGCSVDSKVVPNSHTEHVSSTTSTTRELKEWLSSCFGWELVGRFIPHCNSCSSLCVVPVKRNICHGLLPPCEMFGWILLAQQSELHFKYCWLNLAVTGAAPYWAVTGHVLSRSLSTVPNFPFCCRPARQKSMECSVWESIQGAIALQKSCIGRNFVGF